MSSTEPRATCLRPITTKAGRVLCAAVVTLATACGGGNEPTPAFNGSPPVTAAPPPAPAASPSDIRDYGWRGAYGAQTSGTPTLHLIVATSSNYALGVYGEGADADFKALGLLSNLWRETSPIHFQVYDTWRSEVTGDMLLDPSGPAISGTFSRGGDQRSITGGAHSAPGYRFDQPVTLATVAGHWDLTTSQDRQISMEIDANGNITGTSGSCSIFDSKIKPTMTGHGLFAINLRFRNGPWACEEPHGQSDGVYGFAVAYATSSGGTQLVIAAENGWDPVSLAAAGKR